jgi:hypothetical protein
MYATYYKRVFARSLQETIGFTKQRVIIPSSIGVGIAIALGKFGGAHLTPCALLTNVILIVLVYILFVALWFLWNFFVAAPVFLDNQLGIKVTGLETAESERKKKAADQKRFALLMADGQHLYWEIADLRGEDLEAWDVRLTEWQTSVRVALEEMNFLADSHEFTRAPDEIDPLVPEGGVKDLRWKQEVRRRKLQEQQRKLEEIVQRRLP